MSIDWLLTRNKEIEPKKRKSNRNKNQTETGTYLKHSSFKTSGFFNENSNFDMFINSSCERSHESALGTSQHRSHNSPLSICNEQHYQISCYPCLY